MATYPFATADARCACQMALAHGRLLRLHGLFKTQTALPERPGFFLLRPSSSCDFTTLSHDQDSKPPS
ncbi:MAG: hypothetical protein PHY92_08355 [Alphaproteobacteria bacterium]|nr:hypothetical protein [Alphaproteobacteria bacterium]